MAKVYPQTSTSSSLEREIFTIWLKSLVLNGNGCTVYSSNGQIVYRLDNYDVKSSDEFCLMDIRGNVMCIILRKKFRLFGSWDGHNCDGPRMKNEKPWFQVKKISSILKGNLAYQAIVGSVGTQEKFYKIEGEHTDKQTYFKIIDNEQRIVAEVKQKQSSGVVLGNDVLSLVVEPNVDHSLIIALATFYGLIRNQR